MHSAVLRRALATSLAAGLGLVASAAAASPSLELTSIVGRLEYGGGATELLVEVRNPDHASVHGTIELRRSGSGSVAAHAPFDVPAGERRHVRIPVASGAERFAVTAVDDAGNVLARTGDERADRTSLAIFEIPPSDDDRLQALKSNVVHAPGRNETVSLGHAAIDATTGVPILSERAVVYEGISLVVIPARVLARLVPAQRDALLGWVRTGGALAIGVSQASELGGLEGLVGAGVRMQPADELPLDDRGASPGKNANLFVYEGGRLRTGPFGGVAELGLGTVHLLAVDPWSTAANGNEWVQDHLADVAADRPARFRPYADSAAVSAVKYLDPNEGYRSVIVLVGLLLAAHAVGTALGFRRIALRRGMGPAYRFAAVTSAATFAAVAGLGVYARGGLAARSRELAFVEVASGERLAWVQRHRAFFASDARKVDIVPRDPANLLTPLGREDREPAVRVDGSGVVSLVGVQVRPWQTTAVLEKGTTTLPGAISLRREGDTVLVRNGTGRTLHKVVVSDPQRGCLAFGEIPGGAESTSATARPSNACTMTERESAPWRAFDAMFTTQPEPRLLPEKRLTLVGELDPDGAPLDDGGMPVDQRLVIVRVSGGAS